MVYFMMAGGRIPSFSYTPMPTKRSRGACSKKSCSHQAIPATSRRRSGRVPSSGRVTQSRRKDGRRSSLRHIFAISKLSKAKRLSSKSLRNYKNLSTTGSPSTTPDPNRTTLADNLQEKEAGVIGCETQELESDLSFAQTPSPSEYLHFQFLQITCSPAHDNSNNLPPRYTTLDPYPVISTGIRGRTTAPKSNLMRRTGRKYMPKQLRKTFSRLPKA